MTTEWQNEQYKAKLKDLTRKYESLSDMYERADYELEDLRDKFRRLRQENDQLRGAERDLRRVRDVLGDRTIEQAILTAESMERQVKQKSRLRSDNRISL